MSVCAHMYVCVSGWVSVCEGKCCPEGELTQAGKTL